MDAGEHFTRTWTTWLARSGHEILKFGATNTKETPSLSQLRSDVATTDAWYVNHVAGLTAPITAETWVSAQVPPRDLCTRFLHQSEPARREA